MPWLHRVYPAAPPGCSAVLLCVPGNLAAIVTGKISELLARGEWDTRGDWEQGAAAIKGVLAEMACIDLLTERLDETNTLLARSFGLDSTSAAALPHTAAALAAGGDSVNPTGAAALAAALGYDDVDTLRAHIDDLIAASGDEEAKLEQMRLLLVAIHALI